MYTSILTNSMTGRGVRNRISRPNRRRCHKNGKSLSVRMKHLFLKQSLVVKAASSTEVVTITITI